jgi:hypothetical protein
VTDIQVFGKRAMEALLSNLLLEINVKVYYFKRTKRRSNEISKITDGTKSGFQQDLYSANARILAL